ncbi:hypothetical protein GQ53DRAFT_880711 [Thozetella sp. PMI_491]|nr:hypothetical protein GQ53DRAFT_880711 [Thozetella sp. PMI_491]
MTQHRESSQRLSASYPGAEAATKDTETSRKIQEAIDARRPELWAINKQIHSNPELGYAEHKAHDAIASLLEFLGFAVKRHAYGLETAFVAEYGQGGPVVAFNAEYDALPGIGHACGHNLIATMSIGAFLGLAKVIEETKITGRVRLIGTPAEEGGGGKLKIIDAGGFEDVDACMMVHPGPEETCAGFTGDAYMPTLANHKLRVRFVGRAAHAAMAPWDGVNALDAAVLAYNGISALRQQMHPSSRVHCIIAEGGERPNVIPQGATLDCYIRCPTLQSANDLLGRVKCCFEGAGLQTGCKVEFELINTYADVRPNKLMCSLYAEAMSDIGSQVRNDTSSPGVPGSTDQGNVTYECPGFHAYVGIPSGPGCNNHTPGFTAAASTEEAHELCLSAAKGMAIAGWRILSDNETAAAVRREFETDKSKRDEDVSTRPVVFSAGFC